MSGGPTSTTQNVSNIPEFAEQNFMNLIGKAESLSQQPYQVYTGQRTAPTSVLQSQAYTDAGNLAPAQQTQMASGMTAALAGQAAGAGSSYAPAYFSGGVFTPQTAGAYMDPFMQNVVALQQQDAQRQADIATTQRNAQAVKAGAFGGSRQAIMDAEAAKNLAGQQEGIMAKGLQSAYERAQGQFSSDAARALQAQQLGEQSRQFGAGQGLEGIRTALGAAGQLGQLGQQQFGQEMDITNLRNQLGAQMQTQMQRTLDQQYADFQAQRDYPYQQIGFLSDLLRGAGGSTRSVYSQAQPSPMQTLAGIGTVASGIFGKKHGGTVGKPKAKHKARAGLNEAALSHMGV